MKKTMIICLAFTALLACNSGDSSSEKKEEKTGEVKEEKKEEVTDITKNPDYQKGLDLVAKSDCFTCHKIDAPLTGPPYRDVANKYANEPDTIVSHLAQKVIDGGGGVWGQVPMTPHPTISKEDAEAMVKYVLLQKSK